MKKGIIFFLVFSSLFFSGCTIQPKPMVGNDRDEHGCIGSAGYTWCEVKEKCLRVWEEPCENPGPEGF